MTDTLLKLQKKLPDNIQKILLTIFATLAELEIKSFVVGAVARDLIFEYVYKANIKRKTKDIDFGVAVESWAKYEQLKKTLILTGKFKDDTTNEQRIWWTELGGEMKIDLVPFGNLESPIGQIAFPPKGDFVMSTVGFEEAFEHSLLLELDKSLTIRIASLAGLVLLKFVAYNDRPAERRRDIQDIFFIAGNYLNAGNEERLYEENADLLDDDFNYETSGARLLGRELTPLLSEQTKDIILKLLAEEADGGNLQRFADIIASEELFDENRYELIIETFRQLRTGIFE